MPGAVAAEPGAPLEPAAPAAAPPAFEEAPCWLEAPAGAELRCGYVTVPLEHADPAGGSIRIAVAVAGAPGEPANPDPVLFLAGGPGQGAVDLLPDLLAEGSAESAVLAQRDLVLVDQRGTGYSEPALDCPELDALDPDAVPEDEFAEQEKRATAACRERLTGEGVALGAFDTQNNVADLDLVRQALGYEQVNLYGVSYGSKLGLQTLRGNPAWVRSAVLESTIAPLRNFLADSPTSFQASLDKVYGQCAADPACAEAYGDLPAKVQAVTDRLEAQPAEVEYTSLLTGETATATVEAGEFVDVLFQGLYVAPVVQELPLVIALADAGEYGPIASLAEALAERGRFSPGLYLSTTCAEEITFSSRELVEARGLVTSPPVTEHFVPATLDLYDVCALWDVEPGPALFRVPVLSDIPTLLVTGEFDPITPPEYGEMIHQALSNSQLVAARGVGHSPVTFLGDCGGRLLTDFLGDPLAPVDASCTQQPIDFLTPDDEGFPSEGGDQAPEGAPDDTEQGGGLLGT
jgi:pimeloyl-ACP methyl ester carboxylesterase